MKTLRVLFLLSLVVISIYSCDKETEEKVDVNKEVYKLMKDYYLWYKDMPSVDPKNYSSPAELVEALKVNPPDKWSYVTTKQELEAYYNQGAYVGFGFGSGFNTDDELIISFVFKNSPLSSAGITRGWQILSIDGQTPTRENFSSLMGPSQAGISKTFGLKSPQGTNHEYTFTKAEISMNTVLFDSVYVFGSTKVGYFVLESFIENTVGEINTVFAKFKSAGINELIVDLRYNGGGQVDVSKHLASLIGGSIAYGKIFAKSYHNDKHSYSDSYIVFTTEANSLPLSKVVFITTGSSASASELVINGLKPFMDVVLVGDKTHGKPVGMYTFTFNDPSIDWAIVPICFTMRNANNEGDFFSGIPVNVPAVDDVRTLLGNINESSLNASLSYLGLVEKSAKSISVSEFKPIVGKGLKAEIGAW